MSLIGVGIGLVIAGQIIDEAEWFGEDFGDFVSIVGAGMAAYGAVQAFQAAGAATEAGVIGEASAVGEASAATGGSAAAASPAAAGELGASAAVDAAVTGTLEPGAATALGGSEGLLGATGLEAGSASAIDLTLTPELATTGLDLSAAVPEGVSSIGTEVTKEAGAGFFEKMIGHESAPLILGMTGGQALTGFMSARARKAELEAEQNKYLDQGRWGVSNRGDRFGIDPRASTRGLLDTLKADQLKARNI